MMDPRAMSCNDWEERLAAVDELSSSEREALDLHLASCLSCTRILKEYRTMQILIQNLPATGPQPEFPSRLRQLWESEKSQAAEPEKAKIAGEVNRNVANKPNYSSLPQFRYTSSLYKSEPEHMAGHWARRRSLFLWFGTALSALVTLSVAATMIISPAPSSTTGVLTVVIGFSMSAAVLIESFVVVLCAAELRERLHVLKTRQMLREFEVQRVRRISVGRMPAVPGRPHYRGPNSDRDTEINQEACTNL